MPIKELNAFDVGSEMKTEMLWLTEKYIFKKAVFLTWRNAMIIFI